MGAMALLPICDSSFTCEDYNTYRAHPWSPFPLRRAHPGPGPHRCGQKGEVSTSLFRAIREQLRTFRRLLSENQGQNLALTVIYVPYSAAVGGDCEDRVLDGPASGEKGSKGGPYMYCDPRTRMI